MVRGGNAHFSTYTREVCNTTCMCIPDSRYGLTLAWVTSENSTMLLESDILRLFFTGPYLVSLPLCSGVWCWPPLRSSTPTSLFASLLSSLHCPPWSPAATAFSPVQPPTLLSGPATNFCSPATNCLSLGHVVNSRSRPLTTSGYGEISGPRILCLVSRQNRLVCSGGLPP